MWAWPWVCVWCGLVVGVVVILSVGAVYPDCGCGRGTWCGCDVVWGLWWRVYRDSGPVWLWGHRVVVWLLCVLLQVESGPWGGMGGMGGIVVSSPLLEVCSSSLFNPGPGGWGYGTVA